MRLTLRTLLAYLDDILEPSQAKEIGARINESPVAAGLVARIRDVMRRRRIAAPEVSGPGATPDANIVAEYLDNTLPADVVPEVERVFLESDLHLAEVAACHQVLTIVLGEPAVTRPELRERMYALGASPDESSAAAVANGAIKSVTPAPAVAALAVERPVVPDYLRRTPLYKRVWPWAAAGVVLAAWVGLIISDPELRASLARTVGMAPAEVETDRGMAMADRQAPIGDAPVGDAPVGGAEVLADDDASNEQRPASDGVSEAAAAPASELAAIDPPIDGVSATGDEATSTTADGGDAPPAPDAPPGVDVGVASAIGPGPVAEASPSDDGGDAPPAGAETPPAAGSPADDGIADTVAAVAAAASGETAPPAPGLVPAAATPPATPAIPQPELMYVSAEGVLLLRSQDGVNWTVLPRRSVLRAGDEIACPEPFTASLTVSDDAASSFPLQLELVGGARLRIGASARERTPEIDLHSGRVTLQRPLDGEMSSREVGVTVDGHRLLLALEQPGARCGLLVDRPEPVGPLSLEPPPTAATIFVTAGQVVVHPDGGAPTASTAAPERLDWLPAAGSSFQVLSALPGWLDPAARPTMAARNLARQFEDEFLSERTVRESITPVVSDRRAQFSRMAAETLALIDDYQDLARALAAEHEETRVTAIVGLRKWLLDVPENADLLRPEVERVLREPADIDLAVQLLWGMTEDDVRREEPSRRLIEALAHDEIVIRELAFYHVRRLTGRDMGYRPNNPEPQRRAALSRWFEHVKKTKGLLGP